MTQQPFHRLKYRPDIEGLRALAILLVVCAHVGLKILSGGFVGVDVFFVLSGYLITALLMQELRSTGKLQLASFYVRRLRRLLPGLFLMLACIGILAWQLLPTFDQFRQAMSAANASAWIGNIYFALLRVGYFSPDAASNLFLHTWSLGVEEQFYLFWPMLMLAAYAGWSRKALDFNPARVFITLSIVGALSLVLCLVWSQTSPKLAFYMMPARGWQFALGALVYMACGVSGNSDESPGFKSMLRVPAWAGWLGLALILSSAIFLNGQVTYPGAWALIPSIGAAAIIAAGIHSTDSGLTRALSTRPMRWLGHVSYSWYLWHWPIILLGSYALGYGSLPDRILLALLSLVIASAAHAYVERPIRHASWPLKRPRISVAVSAVFIVGVFLLNQAWAHDAMDNQQDTAQQRLISAKYDTPLLYLEGCDSWYHNAHVKPCIFGDKDGTHTAVVIGDSIGLQWFPALQRIFKEKHWRLIVLTKSSCPMVDEPFFYARIKRVYINCAMWRRNVFAKIHSYKPDIVILGSTFTYPFSRKEWINGTRKLIAKVSGEAREVYVLRSTPALPFNGPDCLSPHGMLYRWLARYPNCRAPAHDRTFDDVYAWRKKAIASFENVSSIDMTSFVCPNGTCRAEVDGHIVFRDDQHMTASFARSLASPLSEKIDLADAVPVKVSVPPPTNHSP